MDALELLWPAQQLWITASFDGRAVTYGFGELDTLVPAYAASIHKSQGSEYPAVVIPVMTQHYPMLQRNLLYTGVTRGKRQVVFGRAEESDRYRRPERVRASAMVEAAGMADEKPISSCPLFGCCGSAWPNCLGDFCRE